MIPDIRPTRAELRPSEVRVDGVPFDEDDAFHKRRTNTTNVTN
jgi:hypothetical protein